MVLGFKQQFVAPILSGTKKHTIREDITDRWSEGKTIHFATGVRTKNYNNFKTDVCKSVQSISIDYSKTYLGEPEICVDGKRIVHTDVVKLLLNDGFESMEDFLKWFNKDFKGKIIHWTNLKYNGNKNQ